MRKPPTFIDDLVRRFGNSPSGMPWFRFSWADDVLEKAWGESQERFPQHKGFWLLMKFVPWEDYGPWNYEAFGPKPEGGGEYELSQVIALEGKAVELWEMPRDIIEKWMYCCQKELLPHRSEILNSLKARQQAAEEEWHQGFTDLYADATSVSPDLAMSIPGIQPGDQIRDRTAEVKLYTEQDVPARLRKKIFKPGIRQIN